MFRQLATIIPSIAGLVSFFGGIGLILTGAVIAGLAVAMLGVLLMIFLARLQLQQQMQGQQQAQAQQELAQQYGYGQQGAPVVTYPPIVIVSPDANRTSRTRANIKVCEHCGTSIPRYMNTCPSCGSDQRTATRQWRGY